MPNPLTRLHNSFFGFIQRSLQNWLPGALARLTFASVLMMYFLNSAKTKVGDGVAGILQVQDNAYFQILPKVVEQFGYDASQVPVFPYQWIVYAGTYSEFILPVLIVIGLFTRLAALGMIGFVVVQSLTDLYGHGGIGHEGTLGAWFDKAPDALILDQRAFWVMILLTLVIKGAGALSLDHILSRQILPREAQA